jgi:hypothetical protein
MHRMIFGEQSDRKQSPAPVRKIPKPDELYAEVESIDLPEQLQDQFRLSVTDRYFVDLRQRDYVSLYPRDQKEAESKLHHVGDYYGNQFKSGIKIKDAKLGEIECIATVSLDSVKVWKCDDLKSGELKNPFKIFDIPNQITTPGSIGTGWMGKRATINSFYRSKLCPDNKTMILHFTYWQIDKETVFGSEGCNRNVLYVINLETGKSFCKWIVDLNSNLENIRGLSVFPGQDGKNEVRILTATDYHLREMTMGLSPFWQNNTIEWTQSFALSNTDVTWKHLFSGDLTQMFVRGHNWCDLVNRDEPDQSPLKLNFHRHSPVKFVENRLLYKLSKTSYALLDPGNYGLYPLADLLPGDSIFLKRSGKTKSQLFFRERSGRMVAMTFHSASYLNEYKAVVAACAGVPLPVAGLISQFCFLAIKPDADYLHPGIFTAPLLKKIIGMLHTLKFSEIDEHTEARINSRKILVDLLKKCHDVSSEKAVLEIFSYSTQVLPDVAAIINEMRAEMLAHVKCKQYVAPQASS